jgi:carotenoid cleavage dioxygenase
METAGRTLDDAELARAMRHAGLGTPATRAEILEGPYPSMIHDFAVTRNWIVLPIFPLTSSMERAMAGLPPFAWEPDKGTHIAFIPRGGTVADVKWVAGATR